MRIHKEGYVIIFIAMLILGFLDAGLFFLFRAWPLVFWILLGISIVFFGLIVSFFRVPARVPVVDKNKVICPADGKVVVIEEAVETEYFGEKRIQISIFMSPLNVHCQWYPISGLVKYVKYHPGRFLVAWHPKSSTENERTTIVVEDKNGREVLFRQIAGAVARRIIHYSKKGDQARQGENFGFIRFGSRVDLFLPLHSEVKVQLEQKVTGLQTVIAELK